MDHPPSTASSSRPARRALLTSVAALSALAAPVALVAVTLGGSSEAIDTDPVVARAAAEVRTQDASQAVTFIDGFAAAGADATQPFVIDSRLASLRGIVAPTTTVPPAPTTTAPPAPVAPAPAPAPAPKPAAAKGGDPNDPATWDRLAQCESGGNWAANTGNGYYGGLQFSSATWRSVGGTGLPHQNSRETQIEMGKRLQAKAGWSQWPSCTRRLGYR